MSPDTLLLRQINPSFVQAGRVTSQAFWPTPKDESRLSVYDGDQIQALAAWRHFIDTTGYQSVGVMAVSYSECLDEKLTVNPDGIPFKEHVSINFSEFSRSDIEKKSKFLTRKAQIRGWLYQAKSYLNP